MRNCIFPFGYWRTNFKQSALEKKIKEGKRELEKEEYLESSIVKSYPGSESLCRGNQAYV